MPNNTDKQTEEVFDPIAMGLTTEGYPGKREESVDMEDVPGWLRPMQSTSRDYQVGEWESGDPILRTMGGQEYTLKLNPDQRTLRRKITEDVIPAVADYMEDPYLPSKEQLKEFGKETAKEFKDQMERTVSGTGTIGDVLGVAGGTGAVGSVGKAPAGSLRIFAGSTAKNFPKDAVEKASEMYSRGVDPAIIWEDTGLYFNPKSNKWEFELSPAGAKFKIDQGDLFSNYQDVSSGMPPDEVVQAPLKDVLEHKELYKNYPSLKNTTFRINPDLGYGARFHAGENLIEVGTSILDPSKTKPEVFKEILLHELQHGVQAHEGTSGGFSPFYLIRYNDKGALTSWDSPDPEIDTLLKQAKDKFSWADETGKQSFEDEGIELIREAKTLARRKYLANEGEIQARAVELRNNMTEKERRETPPGETYRQALSEMMDQYRGSEMPTQRMEHPKEGYAKGGAVMQEGGFKREETRVEPTTGNEVPPGSLEEEVKDDVDVKLSEGEYVIPADVVRYLGLDKIEKMVSKAKEGLQEMEDTGRMGGKPVDEEGRPLGEDEELTDEEMRMLQEAMAAESEPQGMAMGGAVNLVNQAATGQAPGMGLYVNPEDGSLAAFGADEEIPEGYEQLQLDQLGLGKNKRQREADEAYRRDQMRGDSGGSSGGAGGSGVGGGADGSMAKGGFVKKRKPNQRKKPYKNKKRGLGTRP